MVIVCPNIVNLELDLSPPRGGEIYFHAPDSLQRHILHSPKDVEPSQEVLSPASAHVERLPPVHYPARIICLVPGKNEYDWHYGNIKGLTSDYAYLLELYYPANLRMVWALGFDEKEGM
ncbi:hypothetical protein F5887DRAFT_1088264 [Amanita rubescens]|nr:hypothetical protein F5887DRAFT_1088264 [Amanita rubescens]